MAPYKLNLRFVATLSIMFLLDLNAAAAAVAAFEEKTKDVKNISPLNYPVFSRQNVKKT